MVFSEVIPWMVLSGFVAYVVASSSGFSLMVFPNCVAYSLRCFAGFTVRVCSLCFMVLVICFVLRSFFGPGFLDHVINLMSSQTLSHECKLCVGVHVEVSILVVVTAPRFDAFVIVFVGLWAKFP